MATVTIRNLSDEVVAALKERARRNSRSMEAEVRELLMRSVSGDAGPGGMEEGLARRLPPRRWSVRGDEVMAWIDANPPSPEQQRVAEEWLAEIEADRDNPFFLDPLEDPWERDAPS